MPLYDLICYGCRKVETDVSMTFSEYDARQKCACGGERNSIIGTVQVDPDPMWAGFFHPHISAEGEFFTSRSAFERRMKQEKLYVATEDERRRPKPTREDRIANIRRMTPTFRQAYEKSRRGR